MSAERLSDILAQLDPGAGDVAHQEAPSRFIQRRRRARGRRNGRGRKRDKRAAQLVRAVESGALPVHGLGSAASWRSTLESCREDLRRALQPPSKLSDLQAWSEAQTVYMRNTFVRLGGLLALLDREDGRSNP